MNELRHVPRVIKRSDPARVEIEWADGATSAFTAAQLRSLCPCARCVDELTGVRVHDPASVPAELTQTELRLVGNYAISIVYSDGHHTGIYTWPFLRDHAPDAG
jgi:DUF971 family protein